MFRKILLCSDGSDSALKAAHTAALLAACTGGHVTVLHVATLPASLEYAYGTPCAGLSGEEVQRWLDQSHQAAVCKVVEALEAAGVPYTVRSETGHPAEEIIRVADSEAFDLVVVGCRGLSEVRSFLLGSVSDRVAHHAHCPVMIAK